MSLEHAFYSLLQSIKIVFKKQAALEKNAFWW